MNKYIHALNTGHSTNTRQTERRVSRYLNECDEISTSLVGGDFAVEVQSHKRRMIDLLKRHGCKVYANDKDKWVVKFPEQEVQ